MASPGPNSINTLFSIFLKQLLLGSKVHIVTVNACLVKSDISGPKVVSLDRFHCSPNVPYDLVVLYQFLMYCVMCLVGSLHSYEVK